MIGVTWPNLLGETTSCTIGKHQNKWLYRAVGSPPHGRSKTSYPIPPPTQSVHLDFKNACGRNPSARTRQNMRSTRLPIFCTNVQKSGSASSNSPWKPSVSVKWIMEGVGSPGTKRCDSRPGGDVYWQFRLLNTIQTTLRLSESPLTVDDPRDSGDCLSTCCYQGNGSKTSNFVGFLTLLQKELFYFFKKKFFFASPSPLWSHQMPLRTK